MVTPERHKMAGAALVQTRCKAIHSRNNWPVWFKPQSKVNETLTHTELRDCREIQQQRFSTSETREVLESPPLRSYSDKKDLRHLARVLFFMRGTADAAEGQQAFRMPSRFCKPPESSLVVRFIAAKNELDFKLNSEY